MRGAVTAQRVPRPSSMDMFDNYFLLLIVVPKCDKKNILFVVHQPLSGLTSIGRIQVTICIVTIVRIINHNLIPT